MQKNISAIIFNSVVAMALLTLGMFIGFSEEIEIPSPYGSPAKSMLPPATYFIAALPLGMGLLILLTLMRPNLSTKLGGWLFTASILLFLIGYAISP